MIRSRRVYVDWPTGRGGPYEVSMEVTKEYYICIINGEFVTVPKRWCDTVTKRIQHDRLYSCTCSSTSEHEVLEGKHIDPLEWDTIEPIYRQWEELTSAQQNAYRSRIEDTVLICTSEEDAHKIYIASEALIANRPQKGSQ